MPADVTWHRAEREGVRLWCAELAGPASRPPVLLLHGLAGYGGEWRQTASWLRRSRRVTAPDQRAHGRSERTPADVSRAAFVDDAAMWIDRLRLAPAVVVGQSLGGHTALLLAARQPQLVAGLVVVEATPEADPGAPRVVRSWLERWPARFESRTEAVVFFGGDARARVWADGLERCEGGLRAAFDIDVMVAALAEPSRESYWDEWAHIRCPTLVVRAAGGEHAAAYRRMMSALPGADLVEIADAGHDLHLEQPDRWRRTLERFLDGQLA